MIPPTACACPKRLAIPYGSTVVVDPTTGHLHRPTACGTHPAPTLPDVAPIAPPWPGGWVCEHGESWWITGPDPAALLAEVGCGCERGAA